MAVGKSRVQSSQEETKKAIHASSRVRIKDWAHLHTVLAPAIRMVDDSPLEDGVVEPLGGRGINLYPRRKPLCQECVESRLGVP